MGCFGPNSASCQVVTSFFFFRAEKRNRSFHLVPTSRMHGVLSPRFLGASLGLGVYHCIPVLTYSCCNRVVYACENDQYIQQSENCLRTYTVI